MIQPQLPFIYKKSEAWYKRRKTNIAKSSSYQLHSWYLILYVQPLAFCFFIFWPSFFWISYQFCPPTNVLLFSFQYIYSTKHCFSYCNFTHFMGFFVTYFLWSSKSFYIFSPCVYFPFIICKVTFILFIYIYMIYIYNPTVILLSFLLPSLLSFYLCWFSPKIHSWH